MKKEITLNCYGIVITLNGGKDGKYDGGTIVSDLHDEDILEKTLTYVDGEECILSYIDNLTAMLGIDAIESLILAHAVAGVDVTTPAYIEGIETAIDKIINQF